MGSLSVYMIILMNCKHGAQTGGCKQITQWWYVWNPMATPGTLPRNQTPLTTQVSDTCLWNLRMSGPEIRRGDPTHKRLQTIITTIATRDAYPYLQINGRYHFKNKLIDTVA